MDLTYLFRALLRKKWIIIFSALLGASLGVVFTLFQKKSYVSYAQYTTGFSQTQKVSLALTEILDVNQVDSRFNNVIETFHSATVLGMMSYDLMLHDLESPRPFRELTVKQKKDSTYQKVNFEKAKKILRDKLSSMELLTTYDPEEKKVWDLIALYGYGEFGLSKKLSIERVPHTDYLNVSFSSEKPELSAYIVNTIGVKFKEFYTSLTSSRTKESLTKLDSLALSKRRQVDSLRKVYEDFRAKIGTPNISDAATAAMSGVQELTASLTNEQSKYNTLNQQLSSVNDQLSTLNSSPTTTTHVENNNEEILALREKNKTLSSQLAQKGGSDPDIQAKIDDNNKKILALSPSSLPTAPNNTLQKALDRKDELQKKKLELMADIAASKKTLICIKQSRMNSGELLLQVAALKQLQMPFKMILITHKKNLTSTTAAFLPRRILMWPLTSILNKRLLVSLH